MNHSSQLQETEVKTWLDFKNFGFIENPELGDDRDIFCHYSKVPNRPGIGQRLLKGERVKIRFSPRRDGKLQVDELQFPESAPTA